MERSLHATHRVELRPLADNYTQGIIAKDPIFAKNFLTTSQGTPSLLDKRRPHLDERQQMRKGHGVAYLGKHFSVGEEAGRSHPLTMPIQLIGHFGQLGTLCYNLPVNIGWLNNGLPISSYFAS